MAMWTRAGDPLTIPVDQFDKVADYMRSAEVLAANYDHVTGEYNPTGMGEMAADHFDVPEWLDHDNHEIWDLAVDIVYEQEGRPPPGQSLPLCSGAGYRGLTFTNYDPKGRPFPVVVCVTCGTAMRFTLPAGRPIPMTAIMPDHEMPAE